MNRKILVGLTAIGLISIGIAESVPGDGAIADTPNYTQSVVVTGNKILNPSLNFNRGNYEIIETKPWLKKENQSKKLSEKELRSVLNRAGFSGHGLEMAVKIAFYESTFRPYAFNKSSNCYGLFQINMTGSIGKVRRERYGLAKNEDLYNPLVNASIAFKMSNGGKDWSAWTTYSKAKDSLK